MFKPFRFHGGLRLWSVPKHRNNGDRRCLLTAYPRNMRFGGWILNSWSVLGMAPRASQQRPLTDSVIRGHQLPRKAPGTRQVLQILLPYPKNCHRHIVTLGVGAGGSELHLRCLGHRLWVHVSFHMKKATPKNIWISQHSLTGHFAGNPYLHQ